MGTCWASGSWAVGAWASGTWAAAGTSSSTGASIGIGPLVFKLVHQLIQGN